MWRRLKAISNASQIVDLFHAFTFIMLRHKLGARDIVRKDWAFDKKENFFDYRMAEEAEMRLTYQLHYEPLHEHPILPKTAAIETASV